MARRKFKLPKLPRARVAYRAFDRTVRTAARGSDTFVEGATADMAEMLREMASVGQGSQAMQSLASKLSLPRTVVHGRRIRQSFLNSPAARDEYIYTGHVEYQRGHSSDVRVHAKNKAQALQRMRAALPEKGWVDPQSVQRGSRPRRY